MTAPDRPPWSARRGDRGPAAPFLAVPLLLVNLAAIWGQAGWAYDHITSGGWGGLAVALVFAFAVESIGVYLAWEAHESLMADQASAFLRFGSYAVGLLVGLLNFLHFSATSLAAGVAFGGLSAVSPWLWGIWSRARNRTRLAELGLVDVRGVKLSTARKAWHPIRSVRVLSWAAWEGITDPAEAVAGWQEADRKPADSSAAAASPGLPTAGDDLGDVGDEPGDRVAELIAEGAGWVKLHNETGLSEYHAKKAIREKRAVRVPELSEQDKRAAERPTNGSG